MSTSIGTPKITAKAARKSPARHKVTKIVSRPDPYSAIALLPAEEELSPSVELNIVPAIEEPSFPDPLSTIAILPKEKELSGLEKMEQIAPVEAEIEVAPPVKMTPIFETKTAVQEEVEVEAEAKEIISPVAELAKPNVFDVAAKVSKWIRSHVKIQPAKKRLRVCESVSLGEKRFIAVVQLDGKEFLVGGAPNSLSLLASVGKTATFSDVLNESYEQNRKQG